MHLLPAPSDEICSGPMQRMVKRQVLVRRTNRIGQCGGVPSEAADGWREGRPATVGRQVSLALTGMVVRNAPRGRAGAFVSL